jgi:hypothetical protein
MGPKGRLPGRGPQAHSDSSSDDLFSDDESFCEEVEEIFEEEDEGNDGDADWEPWVLIGEPEYRRQAEAARLELKQLSSAIGRLKVDEAAAKKRTDAAKRTAKAAQRTAAQETEWERLLKVEREELRQESRRFRSPLHGRSKKTTILVFLYFFRCGLAKICFSFISPRAVDSKIISGNFFRTFLR